MQEKKQYYNTRILEIEHDSLAPMVFAICNG